MSITIDKDKICISFGYLLDGMGVHNRKELLASVAFDRQLMADIIVEAIKTGHCVSDERTDNADCWLGGCAHELSHHLIHLLPVAARNVIAAAIEDTATAVRARAEAEGAYWTLWHWVNGGRDNGNPKPVAWHEKYGAFNWEDAYAKGKDTRDKSSKAVDAIMALLADQLTPEPKESP